MIQTDRHQTIGRNDGKTLIYWCEHTIVLSYTKQTGGCGLCLLLFFSCATLCTFHLFAHRLPCSVSDMNQTVLDWAITISVSSPSCIVREGVSYISETNTECIALPEGYANSWECPNTASIQHALPVVGPHRVVELYMLEERSKDTHAGIASAVCLMTFVTRCTANTGNS